jgi:hypothetical protein
MIVREITKKTGHLSVIGRGGIIAVILACVLLFGSAAEARAQQDRSLRQAKKVMESADPFMGDWQGNWTLDDGYDTGPLVAQVIALGKEGYRANFHREFKYDWPPLFVLDGKGDDSAAQLNGRAEFEGNVLDITSAVKAGKFTGKFKGSASDGGNISGTFEMEKTIRLSPKLGAKPPANAVVLFDGKDFDQWEPAKNKRGTQEIQWLLKNGAMAVKPRTGSIITKKKFGDVKLHLEFSTPFMPDARGQGRGNSGVYFQGRYEVQILDSYGLEGKDNECGGIYKVGEPLLNMCAPPTQWQTYDITFRAPSLKDNGEKIHGALLTVLHNGVLIQDKAEASGPTTAAPDNTEKGPGGIYLQDHGNPVQYRNIWLVELPPTNP